MTAHHAITEIPLSQLVVSKLNVRRHGPKDVAALARSIAAHRLFHPLLVRESAGETGRFEIAAGSRRFMALQKLHAEGHPGADAAPCVVLASGDDADAIAASLAENVARHPIDELDQHEAFAALLKAGKSVEDIANEFATTPAMVRQSLALAGLVPEARRRYRAGDIDGPTLRLLTLGSKERQRAYFRLLDDPEGNAPPHWQLRQWMLGGAEIDTRHALFDEITYRGGIASDLFGEARYFTDAEEFWRLQNAAIADRRDRLLKSGWKEVAVIPPAERFQHWTWEPATKAQGGAVVIEVHPSGEVTEHKGLLPRSEARKAQRRAAAEATGTRGTSVTEGHDAAAPVIDARPEMSAPLVAYVDAVRATAVRAGILSAPRGIVLRLVAAHLLAGGSHWQVSEASEGQPQGADERRPEQPACHGKLDEAAQTVRTALGLAPNDAIVRHDGSGERTLALFERLLAIPDKNVMALLALGMARSLGTGTKLIDRLGELLAVEIGRDWKPDEAFLGMVRDREVTGAMLSDVIGERAARSYLTETGRKQRDIILNALAGRGREKVEWQPRWMAFPQARYTKRQLSGRDPAGA